MPQEQEQKRTQRKGGGAGKTDADAGQVTASSKASELRMRWTASSTRSTPCSRRTPKSS